MRNLFFFFLLLFFSCSSSKHGVGTDFNAYEKQLKTLGKTILNGKTEEERFDANLKFSAILEKALIEPNSFTFSFDSLTTIARLTSPDKTFKIFNWHVPKDDGSFEYFGFVQTHKRKKFNVYRLVDKSEEIKLPETKILDHTTWYGAHYYQIVFIKRNNNYVLLGWDGNNRISTKKIIDVISFSRNGTPKFGAGIFSMEKKYPKRIIFEYSKEAVMSLKFHEAEKQIVFDHLAPSSSQLTGQFQYYGPDFSFDALEYKKGKWEFIKDLDARNRKVSGKTKFNAPQ